MDPVYVKQFLGNTYQTNLFQRTAIIVHEFICLTVPIKNEILDGQSCPQNGYCLNGGTCRYFQAIGELSCL